MKKRLYRAKNRGQSIPLIAIMLVVLFGMAALSLDVGSTYARQREVVRATNVAAIEGMNKVIERDSDEHVREQIISSLRSNNIIIGNGPGEMNLNARYLDASGNAFLNCPVGSCDATTWESVRSRITYIRVSVDGRVDTNFARLLGTNDLPVNAVANATRGVCVDGVYPISVDSSLLDLNTLRFAPPDSIYNDEIYRNKTMKRIFLRDTNAPGNFGFLRWDADDNSGNSSGSLIAALTGSGTLGQGFNEADWPYDNSGNSAVAIQEPDGYPFLPTQLNSGDWVAADAGLTLSNGVRDKLDDAISTRAIVTLPIYDYIAGGGTNAVYHVLDLGRFYIRGHGKVLPNSEEAEQYGNDGWYIDLVYLGRGGECANLATGTSLTNNENLALEGQVSLYPHFQQFSDQTDLPIQFVVVLDVSGSMTWNFDGYGTNNGAEVRCQGSGAIQCPANSPWPNVNERRIKIAHDVLYGFVDSVRPQDQVRIVTFSGTFGIYPDPNPPSNTEALSELSHVYPSFWTNDKPTLRAAIDDASSFAGTYQSSGETPSAIGLARALELYENAPSRDPISNKIYKRAVIFLTDGVANVTRNGLLNASETCGAENVDCQDGEFENDAGTLKPIPAMNAEAAELRELITPVERGNGDIYVIALGPTSLEALQQISSFVQSADSPTALEDTLNAIRNEITYGTCTDGVSRTSPVSQIQGSSLPDYGLSSLAGRISSPEVGIVELVGSGGQRYTGKIIWDQASGMMSYRITDIPPGQYTMSYWMAYRGEDGVTRIYDYALPIAGGSLTTDSQAITMSPSADNIGARNQPIVMDMNPTYNVCDTNP